MTNEKAFAEKVDFDERRLDTTNPKHRYVLIRRYFSGNRDKVTPRNLAYVKETGSLWKATSTRDLQSKPGTYINIIDWRERRKRGNAIKCS